MDKDERPKIVLDTSVLIAALRSKTGASAEVVLRILRSDVRSVLSYSLLCEYSDVALRPKQLAASTLPAVQVLRLIEALEVIAEPVLREDRHGTMSVDPNDDMVLETAINGDANLIVTHNIRHLRVPASQFKIDVVTPREFLEQWRRSE